MSMRRPRMPATLLACTVAVGLIVVTLLGCVQATPTPEPATISFACHEDDAAHYEALVQSFNQAYPHITVELRPMDWRRLSNLDDELTDVLPLGPETAFRLQEQGDLLDLDSLIEEDMAFDPSDMYPGMLEVFTREGKTWAIPVGADVLVMYYNRDLFDRYGVPYPEMGWTWSDFLGRAIALRDPDAAVYGYGARPQMADAALFVYQHGGRLFDDLRNPTEPTFDDPLTIEAMQWYADLFHEHDVAPTRNEAAVYFGGGSYAIYQGVRRGQVGMWMGAISERGGLGWPAEWDWAWGVVPLPSDVASATQSGVEGYAISTRCQYRNACWQWITFLSEQMPLRLMPARRSLAESEAYEEAVGEEVAAVARVSIENAFMVSPEVEERLEEPMEAFVEALDRIVNDGVSALEAMQEAQWAVE